MDNENLSTEEIIEDLMDDNGFLPGDEDYVEPESEDEGAVCGQGQEAGRGCQCSRLIVHLRRAPLRKGAHHGSRDATSR